MIPMNSEGVTGYSISEPNKIKQISSGLLRRRCQSSYAEYTSKFKTKHPLTGQAESGTRLFQTPSPLLVRNVVIWVADARGARLATGSRGW
jgi:hypothetical protein